MIYLYSGKPGSGKSLHCASDVEHYVKKGKNVITNYEINHSFFSKRQLKKAGQLIEITNDELTVDFLLDFADEYHERNKKGQIIEKQTLLVIDECQTMFNARSWNKKDRMQWCVFFAQHRKFGYTVILVTQDISFIDKQIRNVLEFEYEHRNLKHFKIIGGMLSFLCGGNLFVVVVKWMSNGKRDHTEFFRGKRKYYRLYDSYKIFDTKYLRASGGDASEQ